jgi:hypothetical protein
MRWQENSQRWVRLGKPRVLEVKAIRTIIAASCIMGLAAVFVGTVSASGDWRGTKARVSSGNSQSILRLWERGADAVVTYEVAGVITDQTRCEGGILTDFDLAHKSAVVHADMNGADCTRIASNPLREPSMSLLIPGIRLSSSMTLLTFPCRSLLKAK